MLAHDPRTNRPARETALLRRLDDEWRWLCDRADTAATLRTIAARNLAVAGLPHPDKIVDALRGAPAAQRDRLLAALLREAAATGPAAELAGRIVLQAMRPLVLRLARQRAVRGRGFDDALGEALAALHQIVRTYPTNRDTKVTANLRMETVAALFGARKAKYGPARHVSEPLPVADVDEVAFRSAERVTASAPTEARALDQVVASERASRARAAGLLDPAAADTAPGGARGELLDVLLWAIEQRVLPAGQARQLAEDYRDGAGTKAQIAARRGIPVSRLTVAHSRAVRRLRAAAARYLAEAA